MASSIENLNDNVNIDSDSNQEDLNVVTTPMIVDNTQQSQSSDQCSNEIEIMAEVHESDSAVCDEDQDFDIDLDGENENDSIQQPIDLSFKSDKTSASSLPPLDLSHLNKGEPSKLNKPKLSKMAENYFSKRKTTNLLKRPVHDKSFSLPPVLMHQQIFLWILILMIF